MEQPKVSVILPAGKADTRLADTLDSLLIQTYRNFEVLCICSGEKIGQVAKTYQKKDPRIRTVVENFSSMGAAANRGLTAAEGNYILILSSGDVAARNLLENCVARAEEQDAEMVGFNGHRISLQDSSKKTPEDNPNPGLIRDRNAVYAPGDFRDSCLSLFRGGLRFRMIRTSLIREKGLRLSDRDHYWQEEFCARCDFFAKKIALMEWHLLSFCPEEAVMDAAATLAAADGILSISREHPAVLRRVMELGVAAFLRSLSAFRSGEAAALYSGLHQRFCSAPFSAFERNQLPVRDRAFFEAISETSYEEMLTICSRQIVVSFTSFPKRISTVHKIVENLHRQTRKPDKVLLYLASEQFPQKEKSLPEALMSQAEQGLVEIKWCSDLRSHKKYYHVMQEYPDSLIVTVDDDLIYPDTMLQSLFESYLCHPRCISAMRAHLVVLDDANQQILPYSKWIKEYRLQTLVPSAQLFATSGAGTLFPPAALGADAVDEENIRQLCPYADDLWLNAMALTNGVTTVLAVNNFYLNYIEGSQEESLQTINVENNQNEVQYQNIRNWLTERHGTDILYQRMAQTPSGIRCTNVSQLCDLYQMLDKERKTIQKKLDQAHKDKYNRGQEIKRLKEEIAQLTKAQTTNNLGSTLKRAVKKFM